MFNLYLKWFDVEFTWVSFAAVVRIVWWSFLWTDGQKLWKLAKEGGLFVTDLSENGCVKIKISWWCCVHRFPHSPKVRCQRQTAILAWIPKIIGRSCLRRFLFTFCLGKCWSISQKGPKNRLKLTTTSHLFHGSSRTKTIALKICLCKRESSCYPNLLVYLYRIKMLVMPCFCTVLCTYKWRFLKVLRKADGI